MTADANSLEDLNAADRKTFVARVSFAFENSPWVAEAAWDSRPFGSVEELVKAMTSVVERADPDQKLGLIREHPDLATSSVLTPASSAEQAAAELDRLPPDFRGRLLEATGKYRERFGFPFVICVRDHDKASILANAEERLENERADEIDAALAEIGKIARLRLEAVV